MRIGEKKARKVGEGNAALEKLEDQGTALTCSRIVTSNLGEILKWPPPPLQNLIIAPT